jgi:hypothetical protein
MAYSERQPLVEKELLTAEGISSGVREHNLHPRSDQRTGMWPNKPSIHPSSLRDSQVASHRPSVGRRILRTLTRFFIAVLIGVGATLAWQSHGDAAREMLQAWSPTLAWLLPVSTTKSAVVAATSPDPVQQLGPLAFNLDFVRRSVEQIAAKQEQMAQDIAALQAVEEDIRQKMASAPPPPAQPATSLPQPKQPQPRAQSSAAPRRPPPPGPDLPSR